MRQTPCLFHPTAPHSAARIPTFTAAFLLRPHCTSSTSSAALSHAHHRTPMRVVPHTFTHNTIHTYVLCRPPMRLPFLFLRITPCRSPHPADGIAVAECAHAVVIQVFASRFRHFRCLHAAPEDSFRCSRRLVPPPSRGTKKHSVARSAGNVAGWCVGVQMYVRAQQMGSAGYCPQISNDCLRRRLA